MSAKDPFDSLWNEMAAYCKRLSSRPNELRAVLESYAARFDLMAWDRDLDNQQRALRSANLLREYIREFL